MFKQVNRRFVAALMAMAVVISNVIAPVSPAFATSNNGNGNGSGGQGQTQPGTYQLAWCQKTGDEWKVQIGGNNKNRYALLMTDAIKALGADNVDTSIANGQQVEAHDQSTRLSADFCDTQFTAPTPSYSAAPTCNANDPISWIYDATKLTMSPATPVYVGHVISATFTPIIPYTLKDASSHTVSSLPLTYTDVQPNNCEVKDATANVTVSDPTCTNSSVVAIDEDKTSHAHLVGALNQNIGSHAATFIAETGHLFANGQSTFTVFYQILPHEVGVQCAGPKPADKETRTKTSGPVCQPGGGGVVYSWTEVRFREVRLNSSNQWVTSSWSPWFPIPGSETSTPATDAECPKPVQTQPTCETNGTLTLPAYKGEWDKDYKYIVQIGLSVKTYDADKTVIITGIPQGAVVNVKLVSDDCFHSQDVIFSKDYTFDFADCIAIPEPQQTDECGPNNAYWDAPKDTNEIHWTLNKQTGDLTATAIGGHFTNGNETIDFGVAEDSNEPCPPVVATPVKPQIIDCEVALPVTLGITYKKVYLDANGNIIDPSQASIVAAQQGVLATANPGYVLSMSNRDDRSYLYVLDFTGMNCGKGSVTPPTVTPPVTTTTAAALPTPAELPHTGSSLSGLLVTLLATLTTYGVVYILQPKRR